jgi:hypothetical protein
MHFYPRRVQAERLNAEAHHLLSWQLLENPVQRTAFRPAVHARIDGMPGAEPLRQTPPLASVLGNVEYGIEKLPVRHPNVAPANCP